MTNVTLRKKYISGNRESLYLDFYPPLRHPETGKSTRREFLKLFLFSESQLKEEKYTDPGGNPQRRFIPVYTNQGRPVTVRLTQLQKEHNKETLIIAENIKAKRQVDIVNRKFGFLSGEKYKTNFTDYFKTLAEKRKTSNHDNWISALHYLEDFDHGNTTMEEITIGFCERFRDYLFRTYSFKSDKSKLSQNSVVSYFNKFKAALKEAFREGYLDSDISARVSSVRGMETNREFLTLKELQKLLSTPCKYDLLKRAAIFSSLTGLRFGDIQKLVWSEVQYSENTGYSLVFRQQKTKGFENLPISEDARQLLGDPGEPGDKVIPGLKYNATNNHYIREWLLSAGITKNITFHCFRHTFATLQITLGTDIYTVSKMLGHKNISTTQIYAKVVDSKKIDAASKIKLNFNKE